MWRVSPAGTWWSADSTRLATLTPLHLQHLLTVSSTSRLLDLPMRSGTSSTRTATYSQGVLETAKLAPCQCPGFIPSRQLVLTIMLETTHSHSRRWGDLKSEQVGANPSFNLANIF